MKKEDLFGLKYYIASSLLILGFFAYSSMIGYKWFNPTKTEPRSSGARGVHGYRYYHK